MAFEKQASLANQLPIESFPDRPFATTRGAPRLRFGLVRRLVCELLPLTPEGRGGTIVVLITIALFATPVSGQSPTETRRTLEEKFAARLEQMAAKCDGFGMKEEAAVTRSWQPPRLEGRQTFVLPGAGELKPPGAAAKANVRFWHQAFTAACRKHATALFPLVEQYLATGDAAAAYQLLHEVARQDPVHPVARRVLAGASATGSRIRQSRGRTPFRLCNWQAGKYWKVESPHFQIYTNHSPGEAIEAARYLEQVNDIWRQMFFLHWSTADALTTAIERKAPLPGSDKKHKVVLFKSRDDYIQTLIKENPNIGVSKGYYAYDSGYSLFYAGGEGTRATWAHEATHQLFQENGIAVKDCGAVQNFWMLEAVALYMESVQFHGSYATTGGFDAGRMQMARFNALYGVFYLPLEELAAIGRDKFNTDPRIRKMYTQAAGLSHFLFDADGGSYRKRTIDFLRLIYQGRDTATALPQLLGVKFTEIDEQYKSFLNVTDKDLLQRAAPSTDDTLLLLPNTRVTDAGLAGLKEYGHLEWLNLGRTAVSDMTLLAPCTRLTRLDLDGTQITGAALPALARLPRLEALDLSGTKIDDASLQHLAKLPALEELYLTGTRITDQGLRHLHGIKTLKVVDVENAAVTPAGVAALKAALPGLQK